MSDAIDLALGDATLDIRRSSPAAGSPSKASSSSASATRHGSRTARSPPTSAIGPERRQPLEAAARRQQHLAAPARAVGAEAGAVVGDADHRSVEAVLGHRRDDVRVVMLHSDDRFAPRRPHTASTCSPGAGRRRQSRDGCRQTAGSVRCRWCRRRRSRGSRGRRYAARETPGSRRQGRTCSSAARRWRAPAAGQGASTKPPVAPSRASDG